MANNPQSSQLSETQYPLLSTIDSPLDLKKIPKEKLRAFAKEVREFLVDCVSQTGGHLGAGLGSVELAVALHYVFDTPTDKLVWDTGHQAYPHKILTERKELLHTIRQQNGLSGNFVIRQVRLRPNRARSHINCFGKSHSQFLYNLFSKRYGAKIFNLLF